MNKQGLIVEVARTTGVSRNDTELVVETVLKQIGETIARGEDVRLVGFGVFTTGSRKPSSGRNPRTGEVIDIAAVSRPKFRPGNLLRCMVR